MMLNDILKKSASRHTRLCPRQILGARIGLAGMTVLGFSVPSKKKELLVMAEIDGCFVDGIAAATGCTVGHRMLRVEDYGKIAATFVEVRSGRAIRIAPRLDVRERASAFAADESRHYFAQLQAYQSLPDESLLTIAEVQLVTPVEEILSRPGLRVNCSQCGEEIMNEREVNRGGVTLCVSCAKGGYYRTPPDSLFCSMPARFVRQTE
jgi:formylmethanofuran dehydrogenase subunit E